MLLTRRIKKLRAKPHTIQSIFQIYKRPDLLQTLDDLIILISTDKIAFETIITQ